MAIKLVGNYAKRLGLPGYSSHQFSVSVETELTGLDQVEEQVARLYRLLQEAVDREIQDTGFVPDQRYGRQTAPVTPAAPASIATDRNRLNGGNGSHGAWACSEKQKQFILRLIAENQLDRDAVEETARERFGAGLAHLNRLQASGLISELIEGLHQGKQAKGGAR